MTMIINPGSRLPDTPQGWTNTYEGAQREAQAWFDKMRKEGFGDIEMVDTEEHAEGRWRFLFRHKVTGVEVTLETHGINDMDAYLKQSIFPPRVYWNGSSSASPSMDDFAAAGFVMTFRRAEQ